MGSDLYLAAPGYFELSLQQQALLICLGFRTGFRLPRYGGTVL